MTYSLQPHGLCSLPGSSVHGILQARVLEWVVISVACQVPLSMEFSRQEYLSGLLFPSPVDLPLPGIELHLLHWQADSPLIHQGGLFALMSSDKLN